MSLSLGTLEIGLGLNTAQYDSGIKSAKDQLSSLERRVTALGTIKTGIIGINQNIIKPSVDDTELTALNQHIDLKITHQKEAQAFFDANPLTIKTDTTSLDNFIADAQAKIEQAITASINGNISINQSQSNKVQQKQTDNTAKAVGDAVAKAVKTNTPKSSGQGFFGLAISSMIAGLVQGVTFEKRRVLSQNISNLINATITKGVLIASEQGIIIDEKFIKTFSRKANKGINDLLKRATNEIVIKPDSPLKQAEQQGLNIEKQLESFLVNIFAGAKATVTQQQKTQQKTKKENLEKTEEALVLESVDLYNVEQKLAKAREFSVKKTLELIRDLELIVSDKIPDGEAVKNISGETDTETLRKRTEYLIGQGVKHSSLQSSNEHLKEIDSLDKKSLNISRQQQQNQSLLSAVKKELQSVRGESPNQEFLKILRDLNNGKLPDEASIPRLIVSDKRLKETGANALYNPTANAIIISSEIEEALNNLNLDESQVTALAHEIKHAIDLGFGSDEGKFLNRVGLTKENNINVDDPELSGFLDQYALRGDKRIELEASAEKTARKYAEQYFKTESPKESKPDAVVSEIQKLTEAILLLATGKNTTNIPLELPLTPVAEQERVPVTIGVNQNDKNLHRGTLNLMPPQIEVQKHTPESIQGTIKTYSTQALQGLEDLSNTLKADIESGDLDKAIDTRNWIKQAGDDARTIINDYIKELKKELGVTRLPPELEKEFTAVKTKITTTQKKASQTTGKLGYYTKQQEKAINAQDLSQLMEDELASFNLSGLTQLAKTASGYSRDDFQSFSKFLSSPKTKELLKEAAVNVVGMSAGMAGGALSAGNPIVSMTSELGASLATRKAVNDIEATIDAYIEMTQQGTGDINGFFEKIAAIIERSKEIAKEKASEVEDALSGDAIGFGVGNISGTVLPQLGINIPMEGAVAAMALTPKLVEAKKKAQSEILSFLRKMTGQSNSSELGSLSQGSTDKYKELLNIYKQIDQIQEKIGTGEDLSSLQQTLEDLIKRSQELMGSFPGNTSQQQSTQQAEEQVDKVIGIFKNGYDKLLSNPLVSGALDLFSGIAGDAVNAIRNPVAAFETIKTKLKETKEGFIAAGIAVGSLAGLVVINTVMGKIANAVRDTGREFENLKVTINTALGRSSEQYLEKLYDQVYELGISFMSATAGYKQFAGALTGTSLQGISEQLFSIIQKVSAVNSLTESETQGVSTALSQMASKGIVSMEELRQQLSERLPGAMQIAARSMNMSLSEFDKAVSSGSIMSEDFLPKFLMQYERFADSGLLDMDKPLMTSEMQFQNSLEKLRIEMSKSTMTFDSMVATMLGDAINKVTDFAGIFGQVFAVINNILMLAFVPALGMALYKLGLLAPTLGMLGTVALPIAGVVAALSAVVVSVGLVTSAFNAGSESIKRNIESTRKVIEQLNGTLNQTAETTKTALSPYGKLGDAIFSTIENTVIKPILPSSYLNEKDKKNIKPFRLPRYADLDEQQIEKDISKQLSEGQQILFNGMQASYSPEKIQFVKDELQRLNLEIDALNAKKISLQINNADPTKINQVQSEINKLIEARLKASDTLLPGGTQYIEKYISILKDTKKQLEGLQETNGFDFAVDIERTSLQIKQLEGALDQLNASLTVTQSSFKVFQQFRKNLIDIPQNLTVQQASLTKESLLATMNKRGFSRENIDFEYRIKSLKLEKDAILETQKQYEKFFASITNSEKTALEALLGKGLNQASLGDIENALEQASRSNLVSESAKKALEYLKESIANKNKLLELENKSLEIEREKIDRQAERNRNARQASIVGANVNERIATLRELPFGGPVASYRDALSEVRNQERLLDEAYRRLESASDDPNVIQQEVDNTRLALEQARANLLQQQTSLQDYYRNLDRQIIDFNRQIEDYRRQIEDAQLSAFKENRSLSESYSDLVRELDKNLLNAQNQLLDTTDRIRVQQVKNRLLIPGTSDAGKELGDIFLEFVQGQADIASRGRTFQSRTEEIETSYISTLRNIRNLQEQQQEAERNRLRTIEDIKRTQENLNRTLADLIRQTNKELGFVPQSIKDIVTNLNTLPEPIKLINSELVAIPPDIKTSGEDLVKSIEETAEAIRKAKEGLILPAPSNFIPAPVWNGGGFLPPPPSQSPSIPNGLTRRGQELSQHLDNPYVKAFLDTIAYAEGTANMPNKGYNTLFGHGQFSSFTDHPRQRIPFGSTSLSASGRYQIMDFTWDEEKSKLGLKDFSPVSQDLVALSRILMRGGLDELLKGDIRGAINATRKEWASFPGANYPGQGMKRMEDLLKVYEQSLRKYQPNASRTQAELDALRYDGNPVNSGAVNRVRQIRRNQGGPEFSSPPPIAQIPTLPNQNQDNFWDAGLPPVLKDNPINFQNPNLPPVPNLPTANLDAAASQIREAEIANQEQEERLRQLESSFLTETTLDRIIKFGQQQEEEARALERSLRDASENVADLTINSKGYLTVQEEINKSATEVSRQYRSQIESLEDQRRTLLLNADAMKKRSEVMKDELRKELERNPNTPISVVEETTKAIKILAKRAELAKEQVAILDQAIEQLGRNQGVAALEASFRKTRDTVRSIRDRLNDLTIQRMKLENQSRPTLFDDSAILAERISLQKEKEELEDYLEPYKDLPQYAEYVANIRSEWEKLAKLRLERVALDASPNRGAAESFFSDIREGKGIGSAFSSLGLNIATKFVEGITKPAIDALTSAIDGFTKPITQAFESVFNAIIGPVGNFFTNALNSIFKPVGNIFSSVFGSSGGGGLFSGLLSGVTGLFGGGLGGLGSIGSLGSIGASSFASAPASAFSLGTGFSLFSDGGKVGDANAPIEKNIISAFQRERAMSGGRKPRLIVANEDELVLNPKETEAYLEYKNNTPIKNYANGGFVGGKPNYSTTSNNNSSNQSLVINNTNNVTVESRNDMGYSLNQLKERENAQNERTKKRFFG